MCSAGSLSCAGAEPVDQPAAWNCSASERDLEEKLFKDGRYVEIIESGDITLTFDLSNGREWKKRVWPRREHPKRILRWISVEELLSYLISFQRHKDWISNTVPERPPSGSIFFFDRSVTKKYRCDGYEWKTRRTMSNTVREDRMKLRVGGYQLVYGCYAHSASDQNFHRRTYWLIQNPSLVMVHYLDSHEFSRFETTRDQPSSLPPHMIPPNWSMLTISDNNLCTLLDITKTADEAKNLLHQLPTILGSTYQHCNSLEEILISNNDGLPVDMAEEYSRSKKPRVTNAPCKNEAAGGKVPPEEGIEEILAGMKKNGLSNKSSAASVSSTANAVADLRSTHPSSLLSNLVPASSVKPAAGTVKVLSQSPHIIMCCPSNGSVSYILTVPTPEGPKSMILPSIEKPLSSNIAIQPADKLSSSVQSNRSSLRPLVQGNDAVSPMPASEKSPTRHSLSSLLPKTHSEVSPSSSSGQSGDVGSLVTTQQSLGKGRKGGKVLSGSKKGKEKAVEEQQPRIDQPKMEMLRSIQAAISSLLDSVAPGNGTASSSGLSQSRGSFDEPEHSTKAVHSSSREATPNATTPTPETPALMSVNDYDPEKFSKFADFLVKMDPVENFGSTVEDGVATSRSSSFHSTESDLIVDSTGFSHTPSSGQSATDAQVTVSTIAQSSNVEDGCSDGDSSFPLEIPEVPMSWLSSGVPTESLSNTSGRGIEARELTLADGGDTSGTNEGSTLMDVDFGLDLDSDSWKQLLDCSPIKEHHQDPQDFSDMGYSQFVDDLTVLDTGQAAYHDGAASTSSGRQKTVPINAGSNSENGMWQNSDPDSIKHWLRSSFPLDEASQPASAGSTLPPTDTNLFPHLPPLPSAPPHSPAPSPHLSAHPSPLALHPSALPPHPSAITDNTGLPQELHDFIIESAANTTTASISSPSSSSPRPTAVHDRSHLGDFLFDTSPHSSRLPLVDYASTSLDYLRPIPGEARSHAVRKTSDVSVYSEPPLGIEHLDPGVPLQCYPANQLHLSLPDLTSAETPFPRITVADTDNVGYAAFPCTVDSGVLPTMASSSSPNCRSSMSPSLQNIPEGFQMETVEGGSGGFFGYGAGSIPSSPSASVSSSSMSMQEMFDDSPSVKELCEMLSESVSMQHSDRTLTDSEQDQLFHAAETIQVAFRKYKNRNQLRNREKSAALLIEKYYKKYRDAKEEKDQAARRIQHQYRIYKRRTRELNELSRAATFIQQMYRFHRTRRPSSHPYQRHSDQT